MRKSNLMSLAVDRHVASGKSAGMTRSLLCVCLGLIAVAGAGPARADAPFRGAPVSAHAADRQVVERLVGDKAARLGRDGSPALQAARLAGRAAPDSLVAAVLMCDFADSLFYGRDLAGFPPPRQSDPYYTAHDSLYYDHQFADVRSFYRVASGDRFEFRYRVHPEVANLASPMSWYGNHPDEGEQKVLLARDVLAALDAGVDFSRYDTVVIVHAGAGEETDILGDSPEQIYSGYLGPEDFALAVEEGLLTEPGLPTDDPLPGGGFALVDHVLILPENEFQDPVGSFQGYFGSLGVYCFEVGLRLGMLSLSDFTPAGRPDSQGVGEFCLMGYGLFTAAGYIPALPCAFNKMLMGWLEPYPVDPGMGGVQRLFPAEFPAADSTLARVAIAPQEYWLVEYRQQDPDGNGIFSFPGDLNGNNTPDYYDADSAYGDGRPTSWYDPATDQREWLDGAEFDFFMSENQARALGVKGAGSGLYVWHVDESVIRAVAGAEGNLYNADPAHKSVDLEEADGIQDLDDNAPSAWFLGGDHDSFRGEGATRFGPDTRPATVTASGLATGILLDGFTDVVRDSVRVVPGETEPVIGYAPWMEFRCSREPLSGGAEPAAVRDLPGRDLRGRHLVAADLDWPSDGTLEIVTAADGGRVLAFRSDLSDFREIALEPGLFAVGRNADGTTAEWTGPPLVADVDGDGRPEIVLSAPTGLFIFNGEDGSEVSDFDADPVSNGLALALTGCAWPPVLAPDTNVVVVAETWDDGNRSRLRVWPSGAVIDLPQEHCSIVAPPVRRAFPAGLALLVNNHEDGRWERVMWLHDSEFAPVLVLAAEPAAYLPQFRAVPQPGEFQLEPDYVMAVATEDGGAMVLSDLEAPILWPATAGVATPFGPDFTHATRDGAFHCASSAGAPRLGWPQRPATYAAAAAPETGPQPLAFDLDGTRRYLFTSPDGRLFLFGQDGVPVPGWPLSGAGETAGTPLLMDLDLGPGLELVAAGSFARIAGVATSGEFTGEPVSRLAVWSLAGTSDAQAVWPMYGGSADRGTSLPTPPVGWTGAGLLAAGSHVCYPSPLTSSVLRVRADVLRDCGVRVFLYNLEGEEVAVAAAAAARAGEPVEVRLDLPRLASGLYLCRLVAEGGGRSETSVVPVAVSR